MGRVSHLLVPRAERREDPDDTCRVPTWSEVQDSRYFFRPDEWVLEIGFSPAPISSTIEARTTTELVLVGREVEQVGRFMRIESIVIEVRKEVFDLR